MRVNESHSVMSDSLRPHGLYSPWNSPGQNTGMGSLSLPQGIFPTQGSNPDLPHCRQILYQLRHKWNPWGWVGGHKTKEIKDTLKRTQFSCPSPSWPLLTTHKHKACLSAVLVGYQVWIQTSLIWVSWHLKKQPFECYKPIKENSYSLFLISHWGK